MDRGFIILLKILVSFLTIMISIGIYRLFNNNIFCAIFTAMVLEHRLLSILNIMNESINNDLGPR